MSDTFVKKHWGATLLCVALLSGCIALSHPVAAICIADDFSYAQSAEVLARTGHITYNGWSTAMLGWQLYWGALFYRLFGYSQTVIRLAGFTLALLTTALIHRLFLRCGLTSRNATLGTLTLVLSPLFMMLAYSFMSDVPGMFAILVCLYCCVRAVQAFDSEQRSAVIVGWLTAAALNGVVLGSARQIAWIGILVLVPTATWMMRRRREVLIAGGVLWVGGALTVRWLLAWFQAQPYSLYEHYFRTALSSVYVELLFEHLTRALLEFPVLLLPVTLGFVFLVPWRSRSIQVVGVPIVCGLLLFAALHMQRHDLRAYLQPTLLGVLSDRGLWYIPTAYETRPIIMGFGWRLLLSIAGLVATFAVGAVLLQSGRKRVANAAPAAPTAPDALSVGRLAFLLCPMLAAYFGLLLSRAMYFGVDDRYLLILAFGAVLFLLLRSQRYTQERPQRLAIALIAASACYGVLAIHDIFAVYRARLDAIAHLQAMGVPRTAIRGEMEFDGLTEIGFTKHINEARLNPPGAFIPIPNADWRMVGMPHVQPRFGVPILYQRDACASLLPPVAVHNFLGRPMVIAITRVDTTKPVPRPASCP